MTIATAPAPETVRVDLPGRAYDILIGTGLLEQAASHLQPLCDASGWQS